MVLLRGFIGFDGCLDMLGTMRGYFSKQNKDVLLAVSVGFLWSTNKRARSFEEFMTSFMICIYIAFA